MLVNICVMNNILTAIYVSDTMQTVDLLSDGDILFVNFLHVVLKDIQNFFFKFPISSFTVKCL